MAARVMSQERRKAPRVTERIALSLNDSAGIVQTETKNLSASGAYCLLDRFIAPMTKLQLQLEVPNGPRHATVQCSGVVVRVEPVVTEVTKGRYHIAIFFTDLSERDRLIITRFVRSRLSASSSAP